MSEERQISRETGRELLTPLALEQNLAKKTVDFACQLRLELNDKGPDGWQKKIGLIWVKKGARRVERTWR